MADMNIGGMHVNRKMLLISGAAAGGIIFYAYMKRRSGGTSPTTDTSNPDAGTVNDPSIDPSTGEPYSDEFGSGYGSAVGYGVTDPNTGYNYWAANQAVLSVSTNGQWAQAATAYLTANGYDEATVIAAIGKALSSQPLNSSELAIYDAAVAYEGNPPQGATIVQSSSSSSGSTGSTAKPGWARNQRVTATTTTTVTLAWSAASNATGYNIYVNGKKSRSTADTTITMSGLSHNTLYTFGIIPYNHYGDGPASHVQGRTKK